MKIGIIGVNGFIGKHLVKFLNLNYDVIIFDGDILNTNNVNILISKVDIVINLASITDYESINTKYTNAFNISTTGTLNIINAINNNTNKPHLIFTSTGKVYGNNKLPYNETMTPNPDSKLGIFKYATEKIIKTHLINGKYTILRLSNVYGSEQNKKFLIPSLINQLNTGTIKCGNINVGRDFIYITDILDAFASVIKLQPSGIFNIGSGNVTYIRDILTTLQLITNTPLNIVTDQSKVRNEPSIEYLDITKSKKCLKWIPQTTIKEGLTQILND